MLNNLDQIFKTKEKDSSHKRVENYSIGHHLASDVLTPGKAENYLLCFISFYCVDCIELLPHLKEISEKFLGEIILFTNGSEEENIEISKYFDFDFTINTYTKEELAITYRVSMTPFVYLLDSNFIVSSANNIKDEYELNKLLSDQKLLRLLQTSVQQEGVPE